MNRALQPHERGGGEQQAAGSGARRPDPRVPGLPQRRPGPDDARAENDQREDGVRHHILLERDGVAIEQDERGRTRGEPGQHRGAQQGDIDEHPGDDAREMLQGDQLCDVPARCRQQPDQRRITARPEVRDRRCGGAEQVAGVRARDVAPRITEEQRRLVGHHGQEPDDDAGDDDDEHDPVTSREPPHMPMLAARRDPAGCRSDVKTDPRIPKSFSRASGLSGMTDNRDWWLCTMHIAALHRVCIGDQTGSTSPWTRCRAHGSRGAARIPTGRCGRPDRRGPRTCSSPDSPSSTAIST